MDNNSQFFNEDQWQHRRIFTDLLDSICHEERVNITWLSSLWVARLEKNGKVRYIYAYSFPLNDAIGAAIARDKVATYEVLKSGDVAAVEHRLLRFQPDSQVQETVKKMLPNPVFPLVIKPCDKGGGLDVCKVQTSQELTKAMTYMSAHYSSVAVAPFEEIIDEYRVVLLDGQPCIVFRKRRQNGEWRHNLLFGALPEKMEAGQLRDELISLAQETMEFLGLRFAAVDIITTSQTTKVMEVNAGFSLSQLSKYPGFTNDITTTYQAAIRAMFID